MGIVQGPVAVWVEIMVVVVMVVVQRVGTLKVQAVVVPVDDGNEEVSEAKPKCHAH